MTTHGVSRPQNKIRLRSNSLWVVAWVFGVIGSLVTENPVRAQPRGLPVQVAGPSSSTNVASSAIRLIEMPDVEPVHKPTPRVLGPDEYLSRGPRVYTSYPYVRAGGIRVAPGLSVRASDERTVAYAMDFFAQAKYSLLPGEYQFGFVFEAGYSWRTPGKEHQLSVGMGPGWGLLMSQGTWAIMPRIVMDPSEDRTRFGWRLGLLRHFAENGFNAELSYQQIKMRSGMHHDIDIHLGVDVWMLARFLINPRSVDTE